MKNNKYKYGVSFNCTGDFGEIGGGSEGCTTLNYTGNDLDKIEAFLLEDCKRQRCCKGYEVRREHEYIGQVCELGGPIVSVLGEEESDGSFYVAAVIFENPDNGTSVIE